ncbi:MAG: hypothetical protein E6K81_04440 [Candidatus Eisenbacteria bacterium]|uniref:Uncharacterized protein n=1 Tax=Eiseniibacteriota bacterium TaxID=2212470 RepID=A0A538UCN7_UNCEI|nr:MAG: hypothetical protein E6K81_04440 [Candidatus Eisenbacteria bacterium]
MTAAQKGTSSSSVTRCASGNHGLAPVTASPVNIGTRLIASPRISARRRRLSERASSRVRGWMGRWPRMSLSRASNMSVLDSTTRVMPAARKVNAQMIML